MKNYRKKYSQYYGIEIPKGYVIHHIDLDRENNNITNLVMLPSKLHSRYHWYLTALRSYGGDGYSFFVDGRIVSDTFERGYIDLMEGFVKTLRECSKWYDYKIELDEKKWFSEHVKTEW